MVSNAIRRVHWREARKRAFRESSEHFKWVVPILIGLAAGAIAWGIWGRDVAVEGYVLPTIVTVAATGVVGGLVFLKNIRQASNDILNEQARDVASLDLKLDRLQGIERELMTVKSSLAAVAVDRDALRLEVDALKAPKKPDIEILFNELQLGDGEIESPRGEKANGAFCMLVMTVVNTGDPVTVGSYSLTVALSDGRIVTGESQAIPGVLRLPSELGPLTQVFSDDHLARKTVAPIPRGGLAQGRMIYFFRGENVHAFADKSTQFTFAAKDAFGRAYSASMTASNVKPGGSFQQFPGLQPVRTKADRDSRFESAFSSQQTGLPKEQRSIKVGSNAAIIQAEIDAENRDPQKRTLRDFYFLDFRRAGIHSWRTKRSLSQDEKELLSIDCSVMCDLEIRAAWITAFVPQYPLTFQACTLVIGEIDGLIDQSRRMMTGRFVRPGDSNVLTSSDAVFTGQVFVYHEGILDAIQVAGLTQAFSEKKCAVQFRTHAYAQLRRLKAGERQT